jgi:multidrug efflux pump subunit AcrB
MSQQDWEDSVRPELAAIPDARISFAANNGFGDRDYTIYLTGDDPVLLDTHARKIVDELRTVKALREPRIKGDMPRPELVIHARLDQAAELGVTVQSISQTIRIATLGDIPQNAAKFSLSDRQVPIRVSLRESSRQDLSTLENLPVPTMTGGTVPLKSVADISFGEGPTAVRRYNQSRRVMIDADFTPGMTISQAQEQINKLPSIKNLPTGLRIINTGNGEIMEELFKNFLIAISAGVLMVFSVLVLLFARFFQPITILSALPLSLGGALAALFLFGMPFSLPVVIGLLMLMGIVAKNSILLVDFAIEEMRAGTDRLTALVEAGHKRAQPIVMTSVAMIAGMLPTALGIGDASSFRAPMAVSVIGGILTSTLLTLVIVPAGFTIIDDIERWLSPKFASRLNRAPHTGGVAPLAGPAAAE